MIDVPAMTARVHVNAADHFAPRADVVESAHQLAKAVLRITGAGSPVLISFEQVRGVASTFFNTLFAELLDRLGSDQFDVLIECKYGTRIQAEAAQRSLDAVRGDAA